MNDQEAIKDFLMESQDNLARVDREILLLEKNPRDPKILASVFRTFHTIKGTCGFLGFERVGALAHSAESLLSKMRTGERILCPGYASLILSAIDRIRKQLSAIETTGEELAAEDEHLRERLEHMRCSLQSCAQRDSPEGGKQAAPEDPGTAAARSGLADSAIRVDVGLLDKLMNLVGELVLARNQILQFSARTEDVALNATSQRLNLITTELQEGVMKTRMQLIGVVWDKFPRLVRDLSHALGKQIKLEMEGSETELDRTLIEAIKDPLTHIVRNCCDHGLERPEDRVRLGKPAEGRITLRAYHEGGQVNIEISDDGAGVNVAKVKNKAVQLGLVRPEQAERMSDREAVNLIFLPGFSTADQVTSVSGRGVGMDVVRTNIEKIGGMVDVASTPGAGTIVRVKIPLTLAIIPGLVVSLGDRRSHPRTGQHGQRFVIPQASLVELVRLEGDASEHHLESIHGTLVYRLRGHLLPVVHLSRVLGLDSSVDESNVTNIVVLQAEDRQFGLIVDSIKDTQEIVVKPLGKQLKGLSCYAGATIMGDGQVALILDVLGIGQLSGVLNQVREQARTEVEEVRKEAGENNRQTFLLFRVGAFERVAVPLALVARLEEFPQARLERAGKRLVVQYRDRILPLAPLASLLDPGCDDTAAHQDPVQAVVFNDNGRRVGLLVDQLVDIVDDTVTIRQGSARHGLLGSAVIGRRVTDVLDLDTVLSEAMSDAEREETTSIGAGTTVMLAEASPFARATLRSLIEMAGYRVLEAGSCKEALHRLARTKVDLVVAAGDLPEGGGLALLHQMRREDSLSLVPALLLAGNAEEAQLASSGPAQDSCLRSDREAMLRSIRRLAHATSVEQPQPAGEKG